MESLLESTQNTRDLGGYLCADGVETQKMVLIRSDAPKRLLQEDMQFLAAHNIRTVIDLRTTADESYQAMLTENGFRYCPCRISAGSGLPGSAEEVPGSYLTIAESPGMADALCCIAETDGGVLFHCTAGKDRTGVLSAILLLLAGAAEETIVRDYTLTREYGKRILETVFQMFPDADRNIIIPRPEHMETFLHLFLEKYHSADRFMRRIGLSGRQIDSVCAKLRKSC